MFRISRVLSNLRFLQVDPCTLLYVSLTQPCGPDLGANLRQEECNNTSPIQSEGRDNKMSTAVDIDGLTEKGETRVMGLGVGVFLIFFFSMVAAVICVVGATTPRPG